MIAPATAETLEGGSRALVRRWRKPVDQWLSETAAPIDHSMTTSAAGDDPGCQQADDRDHSSTPGYDRGCPIAGDANIYRPIVRNSSNIAADKEAESS